MPLHPWPWPATPWERVHVDFAGPFLGSMFFVLVDSHSKWLKVQSIESTTAEKTIEVLRTLLHGLGCPSVWFLIMGPSLPLRIF